jgi:AcrR family transcriptional regulator
VLQEAWDLLVERGLADLSLSELGRRLDTSAGHLSYYFGSKNGLLLEVLRWSEEELAEQLDVVLQLDVPAEERLRQLCVLFFPRGAGDPRWLLWVELWPRVMHEPLLRAVQLELDAAWRKAASSILRELTGDPNLTNEAAWEHVRALLP